MAEASTVRVAFVTFTHPLTSNFELTASPALTVTDKSESAMKRSPKTRSDDVDELRLSAEAEPTRALPLMDILEFAEMVKEVLRERERVTSCSEALTRVTVAAERLAEPFTQSGSDPHETPINIIYK